MSMWNKGLSQMWAKMLQMLCTNGFLFSIYQKESTHRIKHKSFYLSKQLLALLDNHRREWDENGWGKKWMLRMERWGKEMMQWWNQKLGLLWPHTEPMIYLSIYLATSEDWQSWEDRWRWQRIMNYSRGRWERWVERLMAAICASSIPRSDSHDMKIIVEDVLSLSLVN